MKPPKIIVARSYGQLGNRLYLYGHLIAAAREHGAELLNPCFAEYADLFETTASDLWCRYPCLPPEDPRRGPVSPRRRKVLAATIQRSAQMLAVSHLGHRKLSVLKLPRDIAFDLDSETFVQKLRSHERLLTLGWLFRSETLFWKHADAVREHLRPAANHRQNIQRCIADARRDSDVLVGVHIRRGDYATFQNGQFFYDDAQYQRWMHQCVEHFAGQRVTFLVCSNEPIDPARFPGLRVIAGPGHLLEDMYSLGQTDFLFGPPSTFTGWASFIGGAALQFMQGKEDCICVPEKFSQHVSLDVQAAA